MNLNDIDKIFDIIESSNNICIAGHEAPDGDCIGSVMALYEFLKTLNKNLTVCIDGNIPFNYKSFVNEEIIEKEYVKKSYDVLFILDCSDAQRLGKFSPVINDAKKSICIDHHKTNDSFCDINVIFPEMSSTGELLYDVIKSKGNEISKKSAEYIYMAILTDTGKFSYSNTSSDTHRKAADLIAIGVDVQEMDNKLFNSKPANVVKAYIDCINGIELYYNNKLGIASITQKILKDNNVEMGDIDGVVEFIREIKEVEISCFIKENENNTKVSLRSKNDLDVAEISQKFGGGGHKRAAGFNLKNKVSVEQTKKMIIDEFSKYFGEK